MKVLILGGGISGLSAAWYLKKKDPAVQITLLEKTDRLGGWIQTDSKEGFLFEKGPRTFQVSRSPHLLQLIRDLGLERELIFSDAQASQRYLWHKKKLRSFSSLFPSCFFPLVLEAFLPRKISGEESIYEFACRRFNSRIAETLFDPLALGVYAGDIRTLSMSACFPKFIEWEREKGSVVRGMFFPSKRASGSGLFTLSRGMESLIEALGQQLDIEVVFNCPVERIEEKKVAAGGKSWACDRIVSALPAPAIESLLKEPLPSNSISVVHLIYDQPILSKQGAKQGFGYLIPTQEKEPLFGMVWDSSIFPQQNRKSETRLTAMVRPEMEDPIESALEAVRCHLGCPEKPIFTALSRAEKAIPQLNIGHREKIARFEKKWREKIPSLTLLGNYLEGVSVEASIHLAFQKMSIN